MGQYIKSLAGIFAVAACFVIAAVGAFNRIDPGTCCYRAVCGAIFTYCFASIILKIIARIVLTAVIQSNAEQNESSN